MLNQALNTKLKPITPVLVENLNLSEEQIFLMQIVNGEIELHDNDEVLADLKEMLEL